MIGTLTLFATLLFHPPVKVLVLQSGHRIEVQGDVLEERGKAVFRNLSGVAYSLPLTEIDMKATLGKSIQATDPTGSSEEIENSSRKIKVSEEEKKALLEKLSRNHSGQAPPASPTPPALEGSAPDTSRKNRNNGDEDAWRQRARSAKEQVRASEDRLLTLEDQEQRLEMQVRALMGVASNSEGFGSLVNQLEDTRTLVGYARDGLAAARRDLSALQEEARVKDILPGWLR